MRNNFECNKCDQKFFESHYRMSYPNGVETFKNKFGHKLMCPKCSSEDIKSIKRKGRGIPYFGKYSSASNEQKREMLKKRSKNHSNSNTAREEKRNANEKYGKHIKGR